MVVGLTLDGDSTLVTKSSVLGGSISMNDVNNVTLDFVTVSNGSVFVFGQNISIDHTLIFGNSGGHSLFVTNTLNLTLRNSTSSGGKNAVFSGWSL